ncbi:MAG: hypothetical protein NTW11_02660 [Candidatus Staskawiczbacteria bacterium]|nr:hypothetical protein [Candidatus Staskawiczbacteria bacterium]
MSDQETKACQNCKQNFTVESDDFAFYEKMGVPAPTWCSNCQFVRRMAFRNERTLYKRKESKGGKDIISMYSPDKQLTVYAHDDWWSDNWDPLTYGKDFDFSKPFFTQFGHLMKGIPWSNLLNFNNVDSDYCNITTGNKNCYLVFGGDFNEDCAYSTFCFYSKNVFDTYWTDKSELSYENIDTEKNHKVSYAQYTRDSADSMFIYDGVNLNNCLGCVSLRNKSYCIFNEQYAKEEYFKKLEELDLGSHSKLQEFKNKFDEFKLKFPHKYAYIIKSPGSTGNNIENCKNAVNCFDAHGEAEDLKNAFIVGWGLRDARNVDHAGHKSELVYDSLATFSNCSRVKLSFMTSSSHDITYCYNCHSSNNLFGCVNLRNKSYCILNKQYTKEKYEELVPKIIEHMTSTKEYGEYFPIALSLFAYNETIAQEYFPLTKEQAIEKGYKWKDSEEKVYKVDIKSEDLPDNIKDVTDDIVGKVIECAHKGACNEQCATAFKIILEELQFYRKMNLPLPRFCPSCRHYQRFRQRSPIKLWHRKCMKPGCQNEFETSYAPERPEIIYCESCYQQEIY